MQDVIKKIYDYSLEDILSDRFSRYSRTIIQDRALPDVRDGLKPVQRRILYAMYKEGNTFDKPTKKSAHAVGNIMAKYHPHGDSSIYDALVRMSQWWKQNEILVEMQGNNGSMDGDSAAAMRYTEARLSKISMELLKEIEKNSVDWTMNYDDSLYEPMVLPAKFPNLLVNGSTGISAGYATNIPPHNLGECLDAVIKRIDEPDCSLDSLMQLLPAPDFPTGGVVEGKNGLLEAYQTGRGKINIRSKYEFSTNKGKEQIIFSEIPFEVNKQLLCKKITEIMLDKKIEGISDVRDESDREVSVRIVVELKKDANKDFILNYLLKNTELQVAYHFNMVSIVDRRPVMVGLLSMIDAYIKHQKEIITRSKQFDLDHAKAQLHIVEGLIKALSILDEVIHTIRASKDKADAKINLVNQFDFSEKQAEAIVILQLYRLTNTDVTVLLKECEELKIFIQKLTTILSDPEQLKEYMKEEFRLLKKTYATPRKTEIQDEITEIKIDTMEMIPKEDCIVVVTKQGYVKRVSMRSFKACEEDTVLKEDDYVIGIYELNTMDTILMFTNFGRYLYVPVYEIPEMKWKELGKHISNVIKISSDEEIVASIAVRDFEKESYITLCSKDGMIKRTSIIEFRVQRYSKPMVAMKLKENDRLIAVSNQNAYEIFLATHRGYGLRYLLKEVPIVGIKASGVKAIALKEDEIVSMNLFTTEEYISVFTEKTTGKRIRLSDLERTSRARRGVLIIRDVKTNPYYILKTFIEPLKSKFGLCFKNDQILIKQSDLPILDRYSTGTVLSKEALHDIYVRPSLQTKQESVEEEIEIIDDIDLEKIDEITMTIDDFLDDFETK